MTATILLSFVVSGFLSAFLTWAVRNLALQKGWIRTNLAPRHMAQASMPRLGGVAISATVAAVSTLALLCLYVLHLASGQSIQQIVTVIVGATIAFAVGLLDDFLDLSAGKKILGQIAAGAFLWFGGIRIVYLTALFRHHQFGSVISLLFTILWVLLISNAFNLIDGLDGLAAGSALFSVLTVFIVALVTHHETQSLLAVILAGAVLGFLRYNFNPATIYLGDCGSLYIGTLLAGLTLTGQTQQKSSTLVAVAIPVVAFGLPIVETSVSVIRRFLSGQPILAADKGHFHHQLLSHGWTHKQAVIILYAVSAFFGMLSLALLTPGTISLAIVLIVIAIGVVVGVQKLGYHEFFEIERMARRALEQREVIVNNLSVRRGAEKLAGANNWREIIDALHHTFAENDFDAFELLIEGRGSAALCRYKWQRADGDEEGEEAACPWSLILRFEAVEGDWKGLFEVSRQDSSALLLDINLLTTELQTELARACQRAARTIGKAEKAASASAQYLSAQSQVG